jgi:hypothetical protein
MCQLEIENRHNRNLDNLCRSTQRRIEDKAKNDIDADQDHQDEDPARCDSVTQKNDPVETATKNVQKSGYCVQFKLGSRLATAPLPILDLNSRKIEID